MNHEQVREKIFENFHQLTITHGIKKVTMEKLAKECGISKKTVYKHFDNKDELIEHFIDRMITTIRQGFTNIEGSDIDPGEAMFRVFDMIFKITSNLHPALIEDAEKYYPDLGNKINMLRDEISMIFMNIIRKGITKGAFKNINPIFVESFYMGAVNNVFTPYFLFKTGLGVNEILTSFKSMLLTGLLMEKEYKDSSELSNVS